MSISSEPSTLQSIPWERKRPLRRKGAAKSADITTSIPTTDHKPEVLKLPQSVGQYPNAPLLTILEAYRYEAKSARETGRNPRDTKWRENLDLYWNRFDFSKKAKWQSTAILPEVPQFVDRFAAAMTEALVTGGGDTFFDVVDPADVEGDIARQIKRMMTVWLSQCGRTPQGHPLPFAAVFSELMKLGALMNSSAIVIWKELPTGGGYVSVEALDPRALWVDHTGRGLYRIRRIEIDKSELLRFARMVDKKGSAIYDLRQIELLASYLRVEMQDEGRRLQGTGVEQTSWRKPITLDEYLCTLVNVDGKTLATNCLVVVANERFIIRGPEPNPFWHKKDWIVSTPLVHVPLSVYGRGYMENMGSMARLYNDFTNLLMDAVFTSAMKAFAIQPNALEDPSQADEGVYPNVTFRLQEGMSAQDFFGEIDLGTLDQQAVLMWDKLKGELQEAASFNDLSTGQLAPKARTTGTEIQTAQQNSTAMLRDIARTVETRLLEPILDLVWKTGLQHLKPNDPKMIQAVGEDMYAALYARRKELVERPITFQCKGISTMIDKQDKLRNLLQTIGIVQQNPVLLQKFQEKVDPDKLFSMIMELSDIDIDKLSYTPREKMMMEIAQQMQNAAGGGQQPSGEPGTAPELPGQPATPQTGSPQGGGNAPQSAPGPQGLTGQPSVSAPQGGLSA